MGINLHYEIITMTREAYAALGGHTDHIRTRDDVLRDSGKRIIRQN